MLRDQGTVGLQRPLDERVEIEPHRVDIQSPLVDPAQVEQLGDELGERSVSEPINRQVVRGPRVGQLAGDEVEAGLVGVGADHSQRSVQFVGDEGEELGPRRVEAGQLLVPSSELGGVAVIEPHEQSQRDAEREAVASVEYVTSMNSESTEGSGSTRLGWT